MVLVTAVVVAVGGAASFARPGMAAPVIAAAGDTACDPRDPAFNGGRGTATQCRQLYTSNLLVNKGLAAVLPLGDNQYATGTYWQYKKS